MSQEAHKQAALRRRNLYTAALLAFLAAGFYAGQLLFRLWGQL